MVTVEKLSIFKQRKYYVSLLLLLLLLAGSSVYFFGHTYGQETAQFNIPYGDDPKQTLDLYSPNATISQKQPVIIYVHGGSWKAGTKSNVAEKPSFFTRDGYVFVSVNYRLYPHATYQQMAADVASAVKWVHDHANQYQIDRDNIHLMGHSAGGHLAMLIGTNPTYLGRIGLSLNRIHSIVNLDGPIDINQLVQGNPGYQTVFGLDTNARAEASPLTYAGNKNLPPIFLVSKGGKSTESFMNKAAVAGNLVGSFETKTLTHREVTKLFGVSSSSVEAQNMTTAVMEFLKRAGEQ
ncbi:MULTISPECIES: alpha/beta hydrolase [Bacillaceae]|uniref:alpha/beta hydrolase n=1 Tax=Bacillaceae TaxID=186817 RepID=UPI001A998B9F|nr:MULTISPECIES: alpha/beta hydrolase [Bacillaceae]